MGSRVTDADKTVSCLAFLWHCPLLPGRAEHFTYIHSSVCTQLSCCCLHLHSHMLNTLLMGHTCILMCMSTPLMGRQPSQSSTFKGELDSECLWANRQALLTCMHIPI